MASMLSVAAVPLSATSRAASAAPAGASHAARRDAEAMAQSAEDQGASRAPGLKGLQAKEMAGWCSSVWGRRLRR
jgi:hypothetical protein